MIDRAPLVVLATLPAPVQARCDALRRAHYPPERNHVPAHVTLFHALPGVCVAEATDLLRDLARTTPPPAAMLTRVLDFGTGTAFAIESPALLALRSTIAERFHGLLTEQDMAARPRLHVTVQNKVTRPVARALQTALAADWHEQRFAFAGLSLQRYRGGPWEPLGAWGFRGRG